jgi:hypothetical protein
MLLGSQHFNHRFANRIARGALYIAMIVFVAQLMGMGFHNHDITEESHECVSCNLAAHLPSGTPAVSIDVAPTLTILYYQVAPLPFYFFLARQSYLIPHSQAPPRHPSL